MSYRKPPTNYCRLLSPPNSNSDVMIKFSNVISYLRPQNFSNLTICGDFNIDTGGTSSCHLNSLLQLQLDCDLTQVVNEPTRSSNSRSSTIDLVLLSNPSQLASCNVLPPIGSSDHFSVSVTLNLPQKKKQTQPRMKSVWIYKAADIPLGRKLISSFPLAGPSDDIDAYWRKWSNDFLSIMEKCIPRKRVPIESKMPWINGEIRRDISKRERLFRRFKHSLSFDILQKYNRRINPRPDLSSMSLMHDSISVSILYLRQSVTSQSLLFLLF